MTVVVSDLTKTYGSQKAVDHISFSAGKGEILGFLGPNGAGKSTTMKIATAFIPPTSGTVMVEGFDVTKDPLAVRRTVGYLPEHNPLYLDMYVHEYLRFIGNLHKLRGKSLNERVKEMVEMVGLGREQHKKIGMLSKGYRQRVGLAQALIHDPSVLILDEPTTGLDPNQIVEIRNLIKNIAQNKTVIFSTHIMQEVQALCNRVVIINLGRIVADSKVEDLQRVNEKETALVVEFDMDVDTSIFSSLEGLKKVESLGGKKYRFVTIEKDLRGDIFRIASEKGWTLMSLKQEEKSLELVFQQLTGKKEGEEIKN